MLDQLPGISNQVYFQAYKTLKIQPKSQKS